MLVCVLNWLTDVVHCRWLLLQMLPFCQTLLEGDYYNKCPGPCRENNSAFVQ